MFELNCIFEEILEEKSGDKADGTGQWNLCNFLCSHMDGTYKNHVVFNSMYKPVIERVQALKHGDAVKIEFSPSSSKWEAENKWFGKTVAKKVFKDESKGEIL